MKEQDIRPADLFEEYLALTASDAARFFDPSRFVAVPCPGCGGTSQHGAFVKDRFSYVECVDCDTLFVSPRPQREALDRFYGDSPSATYWAETFFPASMQARRERIFAPRAARVAEIAGGGRGGTTVIDVGAGYGLFLEEYGRLRPDAELRAIEPGQKLADVCRSKGLITLQAPVEEADAWAGTADLAVCFEVLEHVFSPLEFITSMSRLLKPGGRLLVSSLGVEGFDIQVLWERSRSVSPPHHLNFPSVAGFRRMFERAGLIDVSVLTPGRLDVDIVRNAVAADPALLESSRFLRVLLERRSPEVHDAFQQFLASHGLSSHVWILAASPRPA